MWACRRKSKSQERDCDHARCMFAAAAVSESADTAVVEGSIMLARTVVALAENAVERDRVLDLWQRRAS